MRGFHKTDAGRRRAPGRRAALLLAVTAWLGGCVTPPVSTTEKLQPKPEPVAVVILVSDALAAYRQVADALGARLERVRVYALDGDRDKAQQVIAQLRQSPAVPVVAIGPLAARLASQLSDRPIVFCLDFMPDDRRPAEAGMRGVHTMPPALKQLEAWKMLDPRLERVVLITGSGNGEFTREASAAGRRLGVQVNYIEVQSDRELLYAAKHMLSDAQGLWLAPDNRVLSSQVLREVLAYSIREGKQTLVFNPQLLDLGGLVSVEGDPDDIAARVLEQLRATRDVPRMLPLQRAVIRINMEVANQLGLAVPVAMQGGLYVY